MDDHVHDFVWMYGEHDRLDFIKEWNSGQYEKMSACPSYAQVKLCCDICNMISKYGVSSGLGTVTPTMIVKGE